MKKLKFEWYVLNEDHHGTSKASTNIKPWNIFNNIRVLEETNKLCVEYKKKKMTFEEFTEELRKIIMWQECGRCEYEICVSNWPPTWRNKEGKVIAVYAGKEHEPIDDVDMDKVDCYSQALPNIKIIAKYLLEEYYPRLKINLNTEEEE